MILTHHSRRTLSKYSERWFDMKRMILITIVLAGINVSASAQLSMQANMPTVGFIQKTQLWNILVVNNSAASYDCRINLSLRDRNTDEELLTAISGLFKVNAGAIQLNENALNPIQYNYISSGIDSKLQGLLPVGSYNVCYILSGAIGEKPVIFAENCFQFDVEPLSPPMLTFPSDSSVSESQPIQFIWMPPTPAGMFNNLQYDILITQVDEYQKAPEAIQQNIPFYSGSGLLNNTLSCTGNNLSFEKDKWYAWQVIAKDRNSYAAKSETWVFKVGSPSVEKIITDQAPFLKMKKNGSEKGIAQNGILKLSYVNETTDSIAIIRIVGLSGEKQSIEFPSKLHAGENLFEYDVSKKFKLKDGTLYEAQITNSRNELWSVLFEIHFYKTTSESKN